MVVQQVVQRVVVVKRHVHYDDRGRLQMRGQSTPRRVLPQTRRDASWSKERVSAGSRRTVTGVSVDAGSRALANRSPDRSANV